MPHGRQLEKVILFPQWLAGSASLPVGRIAHAHVTKTRPPSDAASAPPASGGSGKAGAARKRRTARPG
jgi:hypothetical protein